jgi:hypothetical protein
MQSVFFHLAWCSYICTCSFLEINFHSLRDSIQNSAKKNEVVDSKTLLLQYKKRIDELTSQLQEAGKGGNGPSIVDEAKLSELTSGFEKQAEQQRAEVEKERQRRVGMC